jgi:hypothetical protein
MNANELADLIDSEDTLWLEGKLSDICTMLRQQQDRIGVLEANHKIQLNIVEKQQDYIDQLEQGLRASIDLNKAQAARHTDNEPVAWMFQGAFDISTYVSFEKPNPDIYPNPTPLYTHPADESFDRTASHMAGEYVSYPAKTLTDDEIWEVINRTAWVGTEEEIRFKIAEAILRKAQEK